MATEKQIAANRVNCTKSTGPTSVDGKARAAMNAVTHGLTAESVCLINENPEALRAFADALRARYQPSGVLQEEIVDRIILHHWRLERARRAERMHYVLIQARAMREAEEGKKPPTVEFMICNEMKDHSKLLQLQAYEQRIERALNSAINQLIKVRKMDAELKEPARDDANPQNEANSDPQFAGLRKTKLDDKAAGETKPIVSSESSPPRDFREEAKREDGDPRNEANLSEGDEASGSDSIGKVGAV